MRSSAPAVPPRTGKSSAAEPERLTALGERSTRQKRALAGLLSEVDAFRTAQDLHQLLRARGARVGLTTVYNQLRALAEADELDVLRNDSGELLFRQCHTGDHHHHLLCRVCGRSVEVNGSAVESWAAELARREGYADVTHTVEIVGVCADCQPRQRRAARAR